MISQSLYQALCNCVNELNSTALPPEVEDEYQRFNRPYVFVIHQPSGDGFYLDRQYRHIVDVKNCQEPEKPVEVIRHHLYIDAVLPVWANQIDGFGLRTEEFDSFWLY